DMCGASVSILKLDQEIVELFQDFCSTPALKLTDPERSIPFGCLKENKKTDNPELTDTALYASPIIEKDRIKLENITYILQCMTECLDYARNIAEQNDCYKMMLLTGAKDQKTLD